MKGSLRVVSLVVLLSCALIVPAVSANGGGGINPALAPNVVVGYGSPTGSRYVVVTTRPWCVYGPNGWEICVRPMIGKNYIIRIPQGYLYPVGKVVPGLLNQANSLEELACLVHKVVWGDTLSGIAFNYGTSVARIMEINNLRSTRIYAGQKLRLQ